MLVKVTSKVIKEMRAKLRDQEGEKKSQIRGSKMFSRATD
jgi:hypothetical protein